MRSARLAMMVVAAGAGAGVVLGSHAGRGAGHGLAGGGVSAVSGSGSSGSGSSGTGSTGSTGAPSATGSSGTGSTGSKSRSGGAASSGSGSGSGSGAHGSGGATNGSAGAGAGVRSATGPVVNYGYGVLSVKVTAVGARITDVTVGQLQTAEQYSQQLAVQVIPMLRQQVLAAQSSQISGISGATYTAEAYAMSLQAALKKLHV